MGGLDMPSALRLIQAFNAAGKAPHPFLVALRADWRVRFYRPEPWSLAAFQSDHFFALGL
jgi:hypothetical protein